MGNSIDITNNTDSSLKIIVSPSPDWKLADLFAGAAPFSVEKYGVVSTIYDMWKIWNDVIFNDEIVILSDMEVKMKSLFNKYGMPIGAGKMCNMYDAAVFESLERFSASAMEAFRGVFELTVTILKEDRNGKIKLVQYQSMSDYSWKVHNKYVARIKHGTLWEDGINIKEFKPIN